MKEQLTKQIHPGILKMAHAASALLKKAADNQSENQALETALQSGKNLKKVIKLV